MKKLIQDQNKCIGCMACVGLRPDLFALDDATGLAKMLDAETEGGVSSRQFGDDADLDILPGACSGGAITIEAV